MSKRSSLDRELVVLEIAFGTGGHRDTAARPIVRQGKVAEVGIPSSRSARGRGVHHLNQLTGYQEHQTSLSLDLGGRDTTAASASRIMEAAQPTLEMYHSGRIQEFGSFPIIPSKSARSSVETPC